MKKRTTTKHFWKLHVLDKNSSRALQQDDIKLNNSLLIRHQVDFGVYSSTSLNLFAPCHKENTANQRATENRWFFYGIQRYFVEKYADDTCGLHFFPQAGKTFHSTKISSCNFVNNTLLKLLYKTRVLCKCKTEIQGKSIWVRDSTRFELARVQLGLLSQSQKSISYIRNHTDYLMTDKEVELKGFINQRTNKDNKSLCCWILFGLVPKKRYKNLINKKGLKDYRENNKPFLATCSRSNVSTDLRGKSECFGGKWCWLDVNLERK